MAENGLGEITAAEARLSLARKARARSALNLKLAKSNHEVTEAASQAALEARNASRKMLFTAKKEGEEAVNYLKHAQSAAEAAYQTALEARTATRKSLFTAKKEDEEAVKDFKDAQNALNDANLKWEVIDVDNGSDSDNDSICDDEPNKKQKRDMDIFDVSSIIVTGGGSTVVNGAYKRRDKMYCGFPDFAHENNNKILLRRASSGKWSISVDGWGFYQYKPQCSDEIDPFDKKWTVSIVQRGALPTPQVQVKEFVIHID